MMIDLKSVLVIRALTLVRRLVPWGGRFWMQLWYRRL